MKKLNLKIIIGILAVILVLAIAGIYLFIFRQPELSYSLIEAKVGPIAGEVKADGIVKPAQEIKLSFERSAKIALVNVKVGDKVSLGENLASLVNTDLNAQLAQAVAGLRGAESNLHSAQAQYQSQLDVLNNLKNGARAEDLAVSQSQVTGAQKVVTDASLNLNLIQDKAQTDLSNLETKTKEVLNDAYAKAFDAVYIKIADLFTGANSDNPALTFPTNNSVFENQIKIERLAVNSDFSQIKSDIDNFNPDASADLLAQAGLCLENIRNFYKDLNLLLNYAITSSNFSQTSLDSYRANLSLGLTNLNTAIASVQSQNQGIASQIILNKNLITAAEAQLNQANSNLTLAQNQLALKKAGASADQISAQENLAKQAESGVNTAQSVISQAQANVLNFQSQLAKSIINSPIDGTVTQVDAKVGQIAPLGTPLISVISNSKMQIESFITEENIGQVKIGQNVEVTLDAYGNSEIFSAKVLLIDPGETMVNGTPTYKVTLEFTRENNLIRDGLNANIKIATAEKDNAIIVPKSSVLNKNSNNIVLVPDKNSIAEKQVITGVKQNGYIEIISGLSAGEKIVDFGGAK